MMANQYIEQKVNIDVRPEADSKHPADPKNQLTLGDLHGNALKLLYFLVKQNVLVISDNDYNRLVGIYKTDPDHLTQKDLDKFNEILRSAKTNPVGTVRLIGDELGDRGMNDYFTLKILEKLGMEKINVEILLSNHGVEFINAYEKGTAFNPFVLYFHAPSLPALQKLIDKNLVKREEIDQIANQHYKRFIRPISYTYSEDKTKITIYSHAGIDLTVIKSMAKKLKVPFDDKSVTALAQTIDAVNEAFNVKAQNNQIHTLYDKDVLEVGYRGEPIDPLLHPFEFLMWNRDYSKLKREQQHPQGNYLIEYVHGHDSHEQTHKNIYNLDNSLGKSPFAHEGLYNFLFSQQIPAKQFNNTHRDLEEKVKQPPSDPLNNHQVDRIPGVEGKTSGLETKRSEPLDGDAEGFFSRLGRDQEVEEGELSDSDVESIYRKLGFDREGNEERAIDLEAKESELSGEKDIENFFSRLDDDREEKASVADINFKIAQTELHDFLYYNYDLDENHTGYNKELIALGKQIYAAINVAKTQEPNAVKLLTELATITKALIINSSDKINFARYTQLMSEVSGQQSLSKIIGGFLTLFAGAVIIAASIAVAMVSFNIAAPISAITLVIGTSLVAKGLTAVGGLLGVGMFFGGMALINSGAPKGLASATCRFWQQLNVERENPPTQSLFNSSSFTIN